MTGTNKRALATTAIVGVATTLALGRWVWQGTGNVWSKLNHKVYVTDVDLGWRRTEDAFAWLGLDAVGLLAGCAVAAYLTVRTFGARTSYGARLIVNGTRSLALLTLLIPLYAFATGAPPSGAKESRPSAAISTPRDGIRASLPGLPSGNYRVIEHPQSAIVAKLSAGGEVFDARFAGNLVGNWNATPSDLRMPMTAIVSVSASSIETGIDLRNKHALEDLRPKQYPKIEFHLESLTSTERRGDNVTFAADGKVTMGGKTHVVDVVGTLKPIGDELRTKLGLPTAVYVLLQANLSLNLKETIIGNDGTFDFDDVPISVTLILEHTETSS